MSISTRLVLILTLVVGALMAAASFLTLRQRERTLETAMRNEARAMAVTLRIALEEDYADGDTSDAQRLINRLSANTGTYGALLFDERGELLMLSDTLTAEELRHPPELEAVITRGEPAEFVRRAGGQRIFSIILPISAGGARRGAVEVVHPLAFVEADIRRARLVWVLTTLLLLLAIFAVVSVVLRRSLSQPVRELLGGAAALGRGDLGYRVIASRSGGEFAQLAREFNRMADSLAEQRRAALREAEERLRLESDLRHSERLAAVGRLAAGVAHEMGAPLNVIDARAEQLMLKPDAPPESQRRNLSIIRAQTERITHVIRQLLNLARTYDLNPAAVDLRGLAAEALSQFEANAARAGVEVDFDGDGEAVQVEADEAYVRQVLLNVLNNAVQAMPSGGRLRVEVESEVAEKGMRRFASVSISDTGPGIMPEDLPKIFDPFYTTKEVGQGTGLGLSVAFRVVEEHGGWIEAANNRGAPGATFTIYLPHADDAAARRAAEPAGESENARKTVNR